jgi:hypothetical protein
MEELAAGFTVTLTTEARRLLRGLGLLDGAWGKTAALSV